MAKSSTDPKDEEQKAKFFEWLDEWFEGKLEFMNEEKKKNPKAKGFWDLFE